MDKMVNNHQKRDLCASNVNPSSTRCETKLRTLYAETRSLIARANDIKANGQWLYDNFEHFEVETSDDDDNTRSLWSSDDNEHFDPFKDDPTHPDARWSP
ncbi:hypothetical protein Tco_0637764 [Tanacetum coccineum]